MSDQQIRIGAGGTLTLTAEQAKALRFAIADALIDCRERAAQGDMDTDDARADAEHLAAVLALLGWEPCAIDALGRERADGR